MAEFTWFFIRHLFPPAGQLELPSRYVWWQVFLSTELEITKPIYFNETFYNPLDPAFSALQEYSSWGVALVRERMNLLLFMLALVFKLFGLSINAVAIFSISLVLNVLVALLEILNCDEIMCSIWWYSAVLSSMCPFSCLPFILMEKLKNKEI